MKTSNVILFFLSVGLLLAVGWQRQTLTALRSETAALSDVPAEENRLRVQLKAATNSPPLAEVTDELARLKEENRDLLKLRNDIRALREPKAEFERLSAENKRLKAREELARSQATNRFTPVTVTLESLSNQGLASPEAAVQTYFWSRRVGDLAAFRNCLLPKNLIGQPPMEVGEFAKYAASSYSVGTVFAIVVRQETSPEEILLGLDIRTSWGANKKIINTRRVGNEWKLDLSPMDLF